MNSLSPWVLGSMVGWSFCGRGGKYKQARLLLPSPSVALRPCSVWGDVVHW
jgi:hypothetical protein